MAIINFAVWNMEWMNDLFDGNHQLKPDNASARGPNPGSSGNPSVLERRQSLSGAIDEMDLDVLVIVEGPNKAEELQLFFDTDVTGTWECDVQPSKGSSQLVGIAIKTSSGKFFKTNL